MSVAHSMIPSSDALFRRDSVEENRLAQKMRQYDEEERLRFLQEWMDEVERRDPTRRVGVIIALVMANRCLRLRSSFDALFQRMSTAPPGEMRYWLASFVPRMGFARICTKLVQHSAHRPELTKTLVYHLQFCLKSGEKKSRKAFVRLIHAQAELAQVVDPQLRNRLLRSDGPHDALPPQ